MKILITAGGTKEKIDSVRWIGNISTGATGAFLADYFCNKGHEVSLVQAIDSAKAQRAEIHRESFLTFDNLNEKLKILLSKQKFDVLIHAAAVSDFKPAKINGLPIDEVDKKLASGSEMTITLRPTFKILSHLKSYSCNPDLVVIGFKLTSDADNEEILNVVRKQMLDSKTDYCVHNDLTEIQNNKHLTRIFDSNCEVISVNTNKLELAQSIHELLTEFL